jgi:hypothetical protein
MTNIEALQEEIERLELHHMQMEIDTEKLLLDDYPDAHVHLAVRITQGFYERMLEDLPSQDYRHKMRALAHAKWFAINRLTTQMKDLVDRSVVYMLAEAEESGWYRNEKWLGYDNMTEFLSSFYEEAEEESSKWYDWKFIVEQVLPAAQRFGISPSEIMKASYNIKKIRGMVPTAKNLLAAHEANRVETQDAEAGLAWMIEMAADPKVTYRSMKDRLNRYEGKKIIGRPDPVVGQKYMTPDNKLLYVIEVEGNVMERVIEMALKNRVDFNLTELGSLFDHVRGMIKVRKEDDYGQETEQDQS